MRRLAAGFVCLWAAVAAAEWRPVEGHIMTRWAAEVDPRAPLPEYPRPQMTRAVWMNLNGEWDYAITAKGAARPGSFQGRILVPFALESALSGVGKPLKPGETLWYRRMVRVPREWTGQRVLLHFGAVDWHAVVYAGGRRIGEHKGGYTPFSFDVTSHLQAGQEAELVVAVTDPTDTWTQARGKQVSAPFGIWYTSVSGIWQTVWMEPVAEAALSRVVAVPDIDRSEVRVTADAQGNGTIEAVAFDGGAEVARGTGAPGQPITLLIPRAQLWSPDSPRLYDLRVSLVSNGRRADQVGSYFAMRKISVGADRHGRTRILLNNQALFQLGPLDQGWWPDGLYTAPTDDALRFDIEYTKRIGMNMIRKHVKVEPARWYYHCDRMGMLVWQDMPNGNLNPKDANNLRVEPDGPDARRPADSAAQFEAELKEMIEALKPFPSIVTWVPFNEGWGQYDTARITQRLREMDPSRLINSVSGWTDRGVGDMRDVHHYPGPALEPAGAGRAAVLGEFGGISMAVPGHVWVTDENWGYATVSNRSALFDYYKSLFRNAKGLRALGMSAAIYTQTTDVEREVNGYLSYDRAAEKFDGESLSALHRELYAELPPAVTVLPDAREGKGTWRYRFDDPGDGWQAASYDDGNWMQGSGAFASGNALFGGGTPWREPSIWLRREFAVAAPPAQLFLTLVNAFSDGEVFLNGVSVLQLKDVRPARRHHTHFDISAHAGLLKPGQNVIAIRASHRANARAVDAGLYGLSGK